MENKFFRIKNLLLFPKRKPIPGHIHGHHTAAFKPVSDNFHGQSVEQFTLNNAPERTGAALSSAAETRLRALWFGMMNYYVDYGRFPSQEALRQAREKFELSVR